MLSVIIPTYRRLDSLNRTLNSLQQQSCSDFEALVIDNAGEDEVEQAVKHFHDSGLINVNYIRHTEGGSSGARMRGVKESKGKLLVFTDDDVSLPEDWLQAYLEKFRQHPEMQAAGGCVKPVWEVEPPEWLLTYIGNKNQFPIFAMLDLGNQFRLDSSEIFFSCNMAIRRTVFDWTGLRPELFGSKTIGSGESGLNRELSEKGCLLGYLPEAVVYHHITAERMTVAYMRKWAWHHAGSRMFIKWSGQKRTMLGIAKNTFNIFFSYFYDWCRYPFVYNKTDIKSIDVQYRASYGLCCLVYLWWMLTDIHVQQALDMETFHV